MGFDIEADIVESLSQGETVEESYRRAARRLGQELASSVAGAPAVLRRLNVPLTFLDSPADLADERLYLVISGGGITGVPGARCMSEQLKGKHSPTRDEVEAAAAICRGRP